MKVATAMATAVIATIAGLATWAFVALLGAAVANVVAILALVQSSRTAVEVRALAEKQSQRIDALEVRRGD